MEYLETAGGENAQRTVQTVICYRPSQPLPLAPKHNPATSQNGNLNHMGTLPLSYTRML